jgi:hypothetical protein
MKSICIFLSTGLVFFLVGCASTPLALAPVGPNPLGGAGMASEGKLQVFSALVEQSDDQSQGSEDPVWYQHTDYRVYDLHGKLVRRVGNTTGHYSEAPRTVALPAGRYLVKARANDYLRVEIPVIIQGGRTSRAHLDGNWKPPAGIPKREVVSMPNGNPVGWRAEPTKRAVGRGRD